jgi:hypothetical protein
VMKVVTTVIGTFVAACSSGRGEGRYTPPVLACPGDSIAGPRS